jgi:uncharacterized protein (DUF1501 family)
MKQQAHLDAQGWSRRDALGHGLRGAFGALAASQILGLRAPLASAEDGRATKPAARAAARSVVFVYLSGGPSHIDTLDPKPGTESGGAFKAIGTSIPGVRISEHLPRLAKQLKHISLVRSMTSKEGSHARARHLVQTGYTPAGPVRFPGFGAVVARECCPDGFTMPPYVSIGGRALGGGYLGARFSPFMVQKPERPIADLASGRGVDGARFDRRRALLLEQEREFAAGHSAKLVEGHRDTYLRSHAFMQSKARSAFDLSKESSAARASYGANSFGQSCLLARRLVEVGVPFVNVSLGGWDTHRENFPKVQALSGKLDAGLGQLLADLVDRDLLSSTLFVCLGEFGRTPRINPNVGRDHWPKAFSALIGGAGLAAGTLIGSTDQRGAMVKKDPVRPHDLFATMATRLGLDRDKVYYSDIGRPFRIVEKEAQVVKGLL